jgi:hypothetical protein
MGTMIWDYGRSLVLVVAAAAIYQFTAVPWIEPTGGEEPVIISLGNSPATYVHWWSNFFEKESWQRKSPKVLETEQGILLFQTWERVGNKRWRLHPLTILLPSDSHQSGAGGDPSQSGRPILVDAPDGAIIHFRDEIDIFSGQTPPLEDGQLMGKIRIYTPDLGPDQGDSLDIRTETVRIEHLKISTSEKVDIQLGRSFARGRDLTIHLKKRLLSNSSTGNSSWDGLDKLSLVYVDEVYAEVPKGGLFGDTIAKSLKLPVNEVPLMDRNAFVRIKCNGAFTFDFTESKAQLEGDVKILHQVEGLPTDRFECAQLRLYVERESDEIPQAPKPKGFVPGQPISMGPLLLRKLEAQGASIGNISPNDRYVTFEIPALGTRGVGRWLAVDLIKQQVSWTNRLPTEPQHAEPSYLKHLDVEFWAPEIDYRYDGAAAHLGWLAASGPGNAVFSTPEHGKWELGWNKSLQMVPDGQESRVYLKGNVIVRNKEQGRFEAAMMDVWLRPLVSPNSDGTLSDSTSSGGTSVGMLSKWVPDRMESVGNVVIDTPQLVGKFAEMALWFAYVIDAPASADNAAPGGLSLNAPNGQASQPWVTQPNGGTGGGIIRGIAPQANEPAGPPVEVTGHRLHGRLLRTPKEMLIDDLTIQGGVILRRESIDPANPLPVVIEGDQLRMSTSSGNVANAVVSGQPARIFVGQGWLEGPVVRIDQEKRLVWIDEPGSFGVPLEALQKPGSANPNVAQTQMRWIDAPRCRWKGRMLFDGKVARMDGGVDFFGRVQTNPETIWHLDGSAEMLEIALNQPIDQARNGTKIELHTVNLVENVDIRAAQTDPYGVRRSLEHLVLPNLSIDLTTQRMLGQGAGSIRSRRPANNKLSGSAGSLASQRPNELSCLHLTFAGELEGFLDRMEFVFKRQIEVGMGPIANWEDSIDVAQLQQLTPGQMLLSCEQLRVYESTQIPSAAIVGSTGPQSLGVWDLEADTNVVFEGRTPTEVFAGTATRLGYQAVKDIVRIMGSPRQAAVLQRTPQNEPPAKLSIRDASFRLKTMEIIDMQLEQFQLDLQSGGGGAPRSSLPPSGSNINNGSPRDSLFQRRP